MPYILVRSTFNPTLPQPYLGIRTYIDFHQYNHLDDAMQRIMQALSANRVYYNTDESSPYRTYWTQEPPYAVLDKLQSRIVAVNTVGKTTIWTLLFG